VSRNVPRLDCPDCPSGCRYTAETIATRQWLRGIARDEAHETRRGDNARRRRSFSHDTAADRPGRKRQNKSLTAWNRGAIAILNQCAAVTHAPSSYGGTSPRAPNVKSTDCSGVRSRTRPGRVRRRRWHGLGPFCCQIAMMFCRRKVTSSKPRRESPPRGSRRLAVTDLKSNNALPLIYWRMS